MANVIYHYDSCYEQYIGCKGRVVAIDEQNLQGLVREVRRQLGISQEDLARKLGVSFATVNRRENGKSRPSKLAKAQLDNFCVRMIRQGKLNISEGYK